MAAGIASLTLFLKDLTTYTSFATAVSTYKDKYVHIVAKLDTSKKIEWNPVKDPNYVAFYAVDSISTTSTKVVYKKEMPENFEKSTRLVLKGYMREDFFDCKEIQLKCPSKYKDEEPAKTTAKLN